MRDRWMPTFPSINYECRIYRFSNSKLRIQNLKLKNGAAIPLSTFSLILPLFWTITTSAEASLPSGPRSRFRNWDISAPSSLLRIHGRRDCSPCTRTLCLASSLTSSALSSIGAYYTTFIVCCPGSVRQISQQKKGAREGSWVDRGSPSIIKDHQTIEMLKD